VSSSVNLVRNQPDLSEATEEASLHLDFSLNYIGAFGADSISVKTMPVHDENSPTCPAMPLCARFSIF
jgi:hypothetical protein